MKELEVKINLYEDKLQNEINEYNEIDPSNQKELERKMITIKRLESYIKGLKDALNILELEEIKQNQ